MNDLTGRRFDNFLMLLIGIMFGIILGLLYCTWYQPAVPIEQGWYIQYAGKSLKPDVEKPAPVDPDESICQCVSFVDEDNVELGLLCRCDVPEKPILWFFEGNAEGLTQLYLYLDEGVKDYYDQLQRQRWPRLEDPDFSEEPFEREM